MSLERRDLALKVGDAGRVASATNALSQSARFLLEREDAETIVTRMEERVRATWYGVARAQGVSERDCEVIQSAFAYPGFSLRGDDKLI
jgi:serine/threonine-protein kinase HipA